MKQFLYVSALVGFLFITCKKSSVFTNNPNDSGYLHNRSVGASSNELLSSTKYSSVKLEIQYMPGFEPDAAAINHLQNFLNDFLNKPSGITIVTKQIPASSSTLLSVDEVRIIENTNRSVFTSGTQIAIYILYTNGNNTDDKVLGVAYRNTSAVLFGKKIHDNSGGIGQASRTKLEATILEHEFGHLLGLVDIGSTMQTNHKANSNHCNNENCLMYYSAETTDILGFLLTGNIPSPDANCIADLRGNGGK